MTASPTPDETARPTPRTDAALVESILCTEGGDEECTVYPAVEMVESDFARQLERECAREKERADRAETALSDSQRRTGALLGKSVTDLLARAEAAESRLAALRVVAEKTYAALNAIKDMNDDFAEDEVEETLDKADTALSAYRAFVAAEEKKTAG